METADARGGGRFSRAEAKEPSAPRSCLAASRFRAGGGAGRAQTEGQRGEAAARRPTPRAGRTRVFGQEATVACRDRTEGRHLAAEAGCGSSGTAVLGRPAPHRRRWRGALPRGLHARVTPPEGGAPAEGRLRGVGHSRMHAPGPGGGPCERVPRADSAGDLGGARSACEPPLGAEGPSYTCKQGGRRRPE